MVEAKRAAVPKPLEQALSWKSIDILQQLAHTETASVHPATMQDTDSQIADAGFKTLAR